MKKHLFIIREYGDYLGEENFSVCLSLRIAKEVVDQLGKKENDYYIERWKKTKDETRYHLDKTVFTLLRLKS